MSLVHDVVAIGPSSMFSNHHVPKKIEVSRKKTGNRLYQGNYLTHETCDRLESSKALNDMNYEIIYYENLILLNGACKMYQTLSRI